MKDNVAIVSHDAGGAEVLSSWLNQQKIKARVVAEGPAKNIFERKCGKVIFEPVNQALENSDWVLSGTGWQTDFELNAIRLGKNLGKKTVAFLDHWVNYRERFQRGENLFLPDELWVCDEYAEEIAKSVFDCIPIIRKQNPYFYDVITQLEHLKQKGATIIKHSVLYVCEPIREHAEIIHG